MDTVLYSGGRAWCKKGKTSRENLFFVFESSRSTEFFLIFFPLREKFLVGARARIPFLSKKKQIILQGSRAWAGWPKRLALVQATPEVNIIGAHLCSFARAIFLRAALS